MKIRDYLYLAVILLILILWITSPSPEPKTVSVPVKIPVTVPVPVLEYVHDTIYSPTETITINNPELLAEYQALQTEVERLKAYEDATKTRLYHRDFNDSIQDITVFSQVQGKLTQQSVHYKTKPREITTVIYDTLEVPVPQRGYSFSVGAEVGAPTQNISDILMKANLGLENKRGQTFTLGYDTDNRIWVGGAIKLFNGSN